MSDAEATGNGNGAGAAPRDASLRVDPRTLPKADQDFAKLMGFGDEGNAPAPVVIEEGSAVERIAAAEEPTATGTEEHVAENDPTPESSEGVGVALSPAEPDRPEAPASADPLRDWEEIHPRPAVLGRQADLLERAERVRALQRLPNGPNDPNDPSLPRIAAQTGSASSADERAWQARLQEREQRIAELERAMRSLEQAALQAREEADASPSRAGSATNSSLDASEKEREGLRQELDAVLVERDRIADQLAIAQAARHESAARIERLEAALQASRSTPGTLSEVERDLRAEVVGLRNRLEEASREQRALREALETSATTLAIARAHADDRQQELDTQRVQLDAIARERALQEQRLDESLARQRELLNLVARVQAENAELRSTQAALEETLEARDREIVAREENLQVTRRGLAAREAQRIEAEERLEQERHRRELSEHELDRARLARAELEERVARRDARIAALVATLARVEEAIGRPALGAQPLPPAIETVGTLEAIATVAPTRPAEPIADVETSTPAATPPVEPAILARWRDRRAQALAEADGSASVVDWLARQLAGQVADGGPASLKVTSLAGSDPAAEVRLVRACATLGLPPLHVRVLEQSESSASPRRAAIAQAALDDGIEVVVETDAPSPGDAPIDVLFLSDALWDRADAAVRLTALAQALSPSGIVLFVDRVAGGPVALSPETSAKLSELWQVLPESWTERPAWSQPPAAGDDGGTAAPSLDLPGLLAEHFSAVRTLGLGHVADLFLGPLRGGDLGDAGEAAASLIESIDAIDESRSILEELTARHAAALFVKRSGTGDDPLAESIGLPLPGPAPAA